MQQLSSGETISRCIIFDKAFAKGAHTDNNLFVFSASKPDGAAHESAVLRKLAPQDSDVHNIGCHIAREQNAFRGNPEPLSGKRRYYCGFRTALVADIPLTGDGFEVQLCLQPEHGIQAHVDVRLVVLAEGRSERATIKAEVGLALAQVFSAPTPHICLEDQSDRLHPLVKDPDCLTKSLPRLLRNSSDHELAPYVK